MLRRVGMFVLPTKIFNSKWISTSIIFEYAVFMNLFNMFNWLTTCDSVETIRWRAWETTTHASVLLVVHVCRAARTTRTASECQDFGLRAPEAPRYRKPLERSVGIDLRPGSPRPARPLTCAWMAAIRACVTRSRKRAPDFNRGYHRVPFRAWHTNPSVWPRLCAQ